MGRSSGNSMTLAAAICTPESLPSSKLQTGFQRYSSSVPYQCTSVLDAEPGQGPRPCANHRQCRTVVAGCTAESRQVPLKEIAMLGSMASTPPSSIALRRVIRQLLSDAADLVERC